MTKTIKKIEDLFDRDVFAEEIFQKINSEYNKSDSSYIFGISGYWGEGKTHLLKLLETKLENDGYTVVWFSPWKFAGDQASLMRRFIRLINKELPSFAMPHKRRVNLVDFERDQTSFSINLGLLIPTLLIISTFFVLFYFNTSFKSLVDQYKTLLVPIATSILIPILLHILAFQKTTKTMTAIDYFDERLDKILNRMSKKVIVFVDDLDRTTPIIAREVLDALRTFFDKPKLSFVVTGDHKILEGFIDPKSQQDSEEGRRFLKKIFNVYWRIPLPTINQIQGFIGDKTSKSPLSDEEKIVLATWLVNFFNLNPRAIERFIETINFNIQSLELREAQLKKKTKAEKEAIDQIDEALKNKLLLIRVLMIQEKAYPLFEKMIEQPIIAKQIEEEIDKGQDFLSIITNLKLSITDTQRQFLSEFLPETPRFVEDGTLKVHLSTFFKLAADIGLSDDRGISLEAFEKFMRAGESDKINQSFKVTGDISNHALKAQQIIDSEGDVNTKKTFVSTILASLEGDNSNHILQLLSVIAPSIQSVVSVLSPEERMQIVNKVFDLIDHVDESTELSLYDQFPFITVDDLNYVADNRGPRSSTYIAKWFIASMDQNIWDAFLSFESTLPKLNKDKLKDILSEREDIGIGNFLGANDQQKRQIILFLENTTNGIMKLKDLLKSNYDSSDQNQKNSLDTVIKEKFGGIKKNFGVKKWIRN